MKKSQKAWSTNECDNLNSHFRVSKKLIKINAKVTGPKLINNGKYTEYNIFISTEFNDWNIQKRYREFEELNKSLIKKIPDINQYFPPKRYFKNSEDTIKERVQYFNTYLHKLFNNYDIFLFDEVIDFICIDKKILELAISKHTMGNKNKENEPLYESVKKSIQHLTKNERPSSFDGNESKKSIEHLNDKINSNENETKESKNSNISSNLNINNEINAKNNENITKKKSSNNIEDFEENNKNYFSNLLEYENSKNSSDNLSGESPYNKIIEEFLKYLNQKNNNKTAIIRAFEEFLKKENSFNKFDSNQIIKLFTGIKNFKKTINKNISDKIIKNNIINENNKESIVRRAATSKIINGKFIKNIGVRKSMDNLSESFSSSSSSDSEEEDSNNNEKATHLTNLLGLFQLIGNYEKNILLSASCLDLLVKLLSHEYNPNADNYIQLFKGRRLSDYQAMKLDDIIKYNRGGAKSTLNSLKVLYILFREEQHLNNYKRTIMKSDIVWKRFNIYEKYYCQ